jgi:hypothetical protein
VSTQPLWGVDRFRVTIDRIGDVDLSYVGPLERTTAEPAPTLLLRRALGAGRELFDWYEQASGAPKDVRDLAVCQLDAAGGRILNCWIARRARPVRWRGPSFDALAAEVAQEELELAYERLDWPRSPSRVPLVRGRTVNPRRREA